MVRTHLPAWCERLSGTEPDGRYVVACYFTRDGHPVSRARAERIELVEYASDGTPLRFHEGFVDALADPRPDEIAFSAANFQFSR